MYLFNKLVDWYSRSQLLSGFAQILLQDGFYFGVQLIRPTDDPQNFKDDPPSVYVDVGILSDKIRLDAQKIRQK